MIAGVADTHAALWLLFGDSRLSAAAKDFVDKSAAARRKIALAPISLAEVVYLIEKNRPPESAFDDLKKALSQSCPGGSAVTVEVVELMRQVSRADVPDMPRPHRGGYGPVFRRLQRAHGAARDHHWTALRYREARDRSRPA